MQLILTYIIVAIALVFAGRGTYRLFRNAKKGKGCNCNCGCGGKERIKKAACKSSFFILMLVSALVRNSQFFSSFSSSSS